MYDIIITERGKVMRKIDKINNEKAYLEMLKYWFTKRGYYNHNNPEDRQKIYAFMYYNFHLSWHKTQKLILKKIPKKLLDEILY